jgi:1-acyl-sn-glycerol-3-phosphate acyltransferase
LHPFPRFIRSVARSLKLIGLFAYASLELLFTRPATRLQRAKWAHRFAARAVRRMGITLRAHGPFPDRGFIVSNHLGYLDIVAFVALRPCVFVSKAELRTTPYLGWITAMAGTVYVDRGRARTALTAGAGMTAAAADGLPVVFFPEGTTSDGSIVLNFHSGLFAQIMDSGQPITAAHVRYRLTQDNGPGVTVVGHVGYWDDTPLFLHIFRLLGLRGIEIEVRFADTPIDLPQEVSQRKIAAIEARDAVLALRDRASPRAGPVSLVVPFAPNRHD